MKKLRHFISVDDLDRELIEDLFDRARFFHDNYGLIEHNILNRKRLLSVFCEPSTRTRFSFEAAMYELGGQVITSEDAGISSSFAKDESVEDAMRVISHYGHIIVLRHKTDGIMEKAISFCDIPFINGGEGKREHPTQTLLDLFTIDQEQGQIDDLTIGMAGDLVNGRTIHSLAAALAKFYRDVRMVFVSPPQLSLPNYVKDTLNEYEVSFVEYNSLTEAPIDELDCLYMTRLQKERFDDPRDFDAVKDCCILRPELVEQMNKKAIVIHPLPRVKEIPTSVDSDPRAKYFKQAANGLYVRMALLEHMLK